MKIPPRLGDIDPNDLFSDDVNAALAAGAQQALDTVNAQDTTTAEVDPATGLETVTVTASKFPWWAVVLGGLLLAGIVLR